MSTVNPKTVDPVTADPNVVNPILGSDAGTVIASTQATSTQATSVLEIWNKVLHAYYDLESGGVSARMLKTVSPTEICQQRTRLVIGSTFSRDFLQKHCETLLNQILMGQGFGKVEWRIEESLERVPDSSSKLSHAEVSHAGVKTDNCSSTGPISEGNPLPELQSRQGSQIGQGFQGGQGFDSEWNSAQQSAALTSEHSSGQTSFLGNMRQDLTLDRFVVGKSNRVAYQAVRAVLREPGSKYNPVFLHGGSGLGKTHLLQALTREFFIQGERRIRYLQCEKFVQKFVRALQDRSIHQFRQEFRSLKVLAIDDVQMIAGKKSSQEELIETIDAITQAGGQVFLACDLPPRQCEFLQLQLRNRFLAGLVARMEAPDLQTRLSILERESIRHGIQVPGEVLHYIAENIRKSVRELLGALTRLFAEVDLRGSRIDLPLARRSLEPLVKDGQRVINIEMIVESVARRWSVDPVEIYSRSRTRTTAMARNVSTYLARILTSRSFAEIGSELGGRTHPTTSSSYRKIRKLMEDDLDFKREVERLVDELSG